MTARRQRSPFDENSTPFSASNSSSDWPEPIRRCGRAVSLSRTGRVNFDVTLSRSVAFWMDHNSRFGHLESALSVLGKKLVVDVQDAA